MPEDDSNANLVSFKGFLRQIFTIYKNLSKSFQLMINRATALHFDITKSWLVRFISQTAWLKQGHPSCRSGTRKLQYSFSFNSMSPFKLEYANQHFFSVCLDSTILTHCMKIDNTMSTFWVKTNGVTSIEPEKHQGKADMLLICLAMSPL